MLRRVEGGSREAHRARDDSTIRGLPYSHHRRCSADPEPDREDAPCTTRSPGCPRPRWPPAIRAKKLSPVEVTQALLDAHRGDQPGDQRLLPRDAGDGAGAGASEREAAVTRGDELGPLHGVPVSIKDLFDVPGLPTTKGSLIYKDNIATSWEYSAKALIDAGGIHLGKTNTPEFGFIAMTQNKLFGATTNPWDTTRIAGGSSGGAASAVAAGLGPIALSSDGGGSIRIPASICGVFGIKPTYGRVPRKPGGWTTMTHRGPITRTVADCGAGARRDGIPRARGSVQRRRRTRARSSARSIGGVKGLRVAWSTDLGFAPVEPEVARHLRGGGEALRGTGLRGRGGDARLRQPGSTTFLTHQHARRRASGSAS